ncbi:S-layer homology domain-containing protein [Paenibacillus turpanensis]|uniref:S-layer homology domain-containing protein n=1 Tax=Paenibacillus turpanensis TaxID=2689078 RepID=UPI00140AE18E|nr:S-layer homology domain-containing protein [Paenibacillus turpanensis]
MMVRTDGITSRLKFVVSVFMALILMLAPFLSSVQAAPQVSVAVGSVSGAPGETVDVAVTLDPGDGVYKYAIDIAYDSNILEPVAVNPVTDKASSAIFTVDTTTSETIKVSAESFGDMVFLMAKQEIFTIHFKIKESAGAVVSNVNAVSGTYTQDDETWPSITQFTSGSVTVTPVPETINVGIGTAAGIPGGTVDVPVSILTASGGAGAYGMQLNFDPSALEVVNILGKSGNYFDFTYDNIAGELKTAWADGGGGDNAVQAGSELFTVTFKIKADAALGDKTITVINQTDPQYLTFTDTRLVEMQKTVTAGKVTVNAPTNAEAPVISMQPEDRTVSVGGTADLVAAATGSGTVSYQWYSYSTNGGTLLTGETNATFSAPTQTAGTTYYYVVMTNTDNSKTGQKTATVTSRVAMVTVNELSNAEAPVISMQPEDRTVSVGGTADLIAAATGSGTVSYQWYSYSTNGGTLLAGETNATLSVPTQTAGTTYYYVVITNTDDSKTGQKTATVTSTVAKVTVNELSNAEAPVISMQPEDRTVIMGSPANLSVAATGTGTLGYQWYSHTMNSTLGGALLAGETSSTFSAPTTVTGAVYYYVVVTNTDVSKTGEKSASVTSTAAKVTVNELINAEAPVIVTHPEDRTVSIDGPANLSVAATGNGVLSYQWYSQAVNSTIGGALLAGEMSSTFSAPTTVTGTTYYYVTVTNTIDSLFGVKTASVTSAAAKVTVNELTNAEAPTIVTQPEDRTVSTGGLADLSVTATASGTLSYQWYSNLENSTIGGTLLADEITKTFFAPTTVTGTTYYYYVVVTNTDNSKTGEITASVTSAAAKVTVNELTNAEAPTIVTQPEDRSVSTGSAANLSVAATASGTLTYQWYSNTENSTAGGTLLTGATSSTFSAPTNVTGTVYYYVEVTNTNNSMTGMKTATATSSAAKVTVMQSPSSTSETNDNAPSAAPSAAPAAVPNTNTGVDVLVNGKAESAGTAETTQVDDKKMITVKIDQQKLEDKLAAEGSGAIVTVPVRAESNIVVGELNGQMVKNMEKQQAKLVIQTNKATYTLPAGQINIDAVSEQIGSAVSLQDIKVQIKIAEPAADQVKLVQSVSRQGEFEVVVPPMDFTVTGRYDGKTVDVTNFNAYVERTMALPQGVDPSQVTTGVVIEPDGTARHVPTQITMIAGAYYAKINSLTNSIYTVIWHPTSFKDVESHWAKSAVNDMGSRMVINGVGNEEFNPDQDITRAEFAAIIVRGLGLKLDKHSNPFSDVKSTDWYSNVISTAYSHELINGFEDGSFRPMEKITREQAMAIIANAMKITGLKAKLSMEQSGERLNAFADADQLSQWAKAHAADSLQAGIVSGRNGNKLAPTANITRAEVAVLVQRLLQKSELI